MESKEKVKGRRIWIPEHIVKEIETMKIHPRQPYYEIIEKALKEYKKK